MTTSRQTDTLTEVTRWEDVPAFANEDEEDTFWQTHALSDTLLAEMAAGPGDPQLPAPRGHGNSQPISVRVDRDLLQRVKAVARQHNVRYQTLIKQWITDRLAAEEASPGEDQGPADAGIPKGAARAGTWPLPPLPDMDWLATFNKQCAMFGELAKLTEHLSEQVREAMEAHLAHHGPRRDSGLDRARHWGHQEGKALRS